MNKTSLNMIGAINLSLLLLITGCESEIKVKGRDVAAANTTGATDHGQLDVTAVWLGAGNYSGYNAAALPVTEVCSTSTIFGAQGTAVCGGSVNTFADLMASMAYRSDSATINLSSQVAVDARVQATLAQEASGAATFTSNHSLVPDPLYASDGRYTYDGNDGQAATGIPEKRNYLETVKGGRPETVCGVAGSIQNRVDDCATRNTTKAIYEGQKYGQNGEGDWKLVSLYQAGAAAGDLCVGGIGSNCFEVWRDERTQLIWSDSHTNGGNYWNWFQAAGYAKNSSSINNTGYEGGTPASTGLPYNINCDSDFGSPAVSTTTCQSPNPMSVCADAVTLSGMVLNGLNNYQNPDGSDPNALGFADDRPAKGGMVDAARQWRLPTKEDFDLANVNGMRKVLPNMDDTFWSASSNSDVRFYAWVFFGDLGYWRNFGRDNTYAVRCVGR